MQLLPSNLIPEFEGLLLCALGLAVWGALAAMASLWCEWDAESAEHF